MRKRLYYRGVEVNTFGIPIGLLPKKKNFSKNDKVKKRQYLRTFSTDYKKNTPKNLLVIYDIPEAKKKERDWFRRQLKNFDFVMIQRSAWIDPSPLPEDFLSYIKRIGLRKNFKTFKIAKTFSKQSTL